MHKADVNALWDGSTTTGPHGEWYHHPEDDRLGRVEEGCSRRSALPGGAAVLSIVYCYSRLPEIKYRGFAISLLFANKVSARKFKSTVVDRTSPFLALLH